MKFAPLLALGLLLASCGSSAAEEKRVRIFASSSLSESFEALTHAYMQLDPGVELELHVAGTPQLVAQITEGVNVDVFASADLPSSHRALAASDAAYEAIVFATNQLAIVVAKGNPQSVAGLADLAREDLLVALCGPEVPAGRYAREALAKAGVQVHSISDEPSVRSLVSKVELGELDAGVVYATDVRRAGVGSVTIRKEHQVTAQYPIAVLQAGPGQDFVQFVLSEEGQRVLRAFGFEVP